MPARLVPALLAVVLATTGCGLLDGAAPQQQEVSGAALDVLATLEVRDRDPRSGYDRELFGERWADVDGNGCDTRNDVLRRDLDDVDLDRRNGCLVWAGVLVDPYSGVVVDFERGPDTSPEVQVDHVVALSDAWQKGAQEWDAATREAFANDPLNLLAVDGDVNEAKSDGDAATWLPPQRGVRCAYVARQVAVKAAYGAWVTEAERDAVARVLADCPDEPVPTVDEVDTPPLGGTS
ncbi:HNH endonuclease family protein [uncultured Pseudokineococcus sp.]|uniref:HNH endonuclease family protein n=1 Tax=uncultured Pseudokineococcus sp. TaxID=1642928 RepID=UPI002615E04F|nr:HNH endonuclease family protein [uncultured Pseudokineococcus sp.]